MLTEKELQWLDNRGKFSCWYCPDIPQTMCLYGERPHFCALLDIDYKDAAEFSERVVVKLAITGDAWDFEDMPCRGEHQYTRKTCKLRKNNWDCADCYIKAARLAVEEEMNENNTMSLPN